ncbi:MAG: hypothetical protein K6T65_05560 [Peptococcaceae bacterium]|nr:hypothetical protein [Peptococcaceae bacterium]
MMFIYMVWETDEVYGIKRNPKNCATLDEAKQMALEVARQWCEDEEPKFFKVPAGILCIGQSDFGALIEEVAR